MLQSSGEPTRKCLKKRKIFFKIPVFRHVYGIFVTLNGHFFGVAMDQAIPKTEQSCRFHGKTALY
jgi:hypothetical protein